MILYFNSNCENTALTLLDKRLDNYGNSMEDRNGVNNYWQQFKTQSKTKMDNDPLKWICKLEDVQSGLNLLQLLPCQRSNVLGCVNETITDGTVRTIVDSWTAMKSRKISAPIQQSSFKIAKQELKEQNNKKRLGGKPASVNSKFVCPFKSDEKTKPVEVEPPDEELLDERLKNIEPRMIELIKNEIMDSASEITWEDIAGLDYAKKIITEVIVFPMLRPDIFTGLRRPPKGILLFGPPGTGKTLIGKCIASQSKSTFFSISASSLTSKWIGEGEKMMRALFAYARVRQPSVVFIDEIDSLLCQRSETEHESSRRLKTEFLVQLDGAATSDEDRILIIGATNRPQELDEAARRRLVKRLYIPLPESEARRQIIDRLLRSVSHNLSSEEITQIANQLDGYSGADVTNLCKEASMGPIRSIPLSQLENISSNQVRPVIYHDFEEALRDVRPSVSQADLTVYLKWDSTYGSGTGGK